MATVFVRIVEYFVQNNIIHHKDKELYFYGLQQGFFILINIITTLLIGLAFSMVWQSIIFMVTYLPLRAYAGGYHARTHYFCYLFSIMLTSVVLMAIKLMPWTGTSSILILLAAGLVIFILAPVEDTNKPLDSNEATLYKKRTRIILCVEICVAWIMLILGVDQILFSITTSLLTLSFMLLLGKVTSKKIAHI